MESDSSQHLELLASIITELKTANETNVQILGAFQRLLAETEQTDDPSDGQNVGGENPESEGVEDEEGGPEDEEEGGPEDEEGGPEDEEGGPEDEEGGVSEYEEGGVPEDEEGVPEDEEGVPEDEEGVPEKDVPEEVEEVDVEEFNGR
jgi:hypothetical protein